jgi:hypothetical protein
MNSTTDNITDVRWVEPGLYRVENRFGLELDVRIYFGAETIRISFEADVPIYGSTYISNRVVPSPGESVEMMIISAIGRAVEDRIRPRWVGATL